MFGETWCSQCGESFGPGAHGYSSCSSHRGKQTIPVEERIICDFCGREVPIVIGIGALWVCGSCFDEARTQWNAKKESA